MEESGGEMGQQREAVTLDQARQMIETMKMIAGMSPEEQARYFMGFDEEERKNLAGDIEAISNAVRGRPKMEINIDQEARRREAAKVMETEGYKKLKSDSQLLRREQMTEPV